MNQKVSLFFAFVFALFLASCAQEGAQVISGNISDAANLNIYFDKITASGNARVLSNAKADASGKFALVFEESLDPSVYRIRVGKKSAYLMLQPTDSQVELTGSLASLGDNSYTISGSPTSTELQQAMTNIGAGRTPGTNMDQFVTSSSNALINAFLANQIFNSSPTKVEVYKKINTQLLEQYPNNEFTKDFATTVAGIEQKLKAQKGKYKFSVGDVAPDIVGISPTGQTKKLSDLKGKVVLIDFWASWCKPCRVANPHVVEIYDKYNKDGFEVYSFSLDGVHPRQLAAYGGDASKISKAKAQQKKRWIDAISQDNLKWDTHASELAHWDSKANKEYGVSSIPTTFLVGRDGTFAAINPRNNLEEAVKAAL